MLYLADTNVLLRFIDSEHLLHERSTDAIKQIQQGEHELKTTRVSGVQVHDARLVAAMKTHGVTHILTFNVVDFQRYADEEIIAVDPLAF
jgi:predicted nucleic acid-binding protein